MCGIHTFAENRNSLVFNRFRGMDLLFAENAFIVGAAAPKQGCHPLREAAAKPPPTVFVVGQFLKKKQSKIPCESIEGNLRHYYRSGH